MKLVDILNIQEIDFIKNELMYHDTDEAIRDGKVNDDLVEKLEDYYELKGFDERYHINEKGKISESIIDKLADAGIW